MLSLTVNNTNQLKRSVLRFVGGFFIFSLLTSFIAPSAQAAPFRGYEALTYTTTAPAGTIFMKPGEVREFEYGFVNIGDALWVNEGSRYNSLYTREPNYRESAFYHSSWKSKVQPAAIIESQAAKGEKAHVKFKLQAPSSTGNYVEHFQLAAEDRAWVPGAALKMEITVMNEPFPNQVTSTPTPSTPVSSAPVEINSDLGAMVLIRSAKNVRAAGGTTIEYKVGIKNTGKTTWGKREIRTQDIALATQIASADTYHPSWKNASKIAVADAGEVAPGALDFIDFSFNAPRESGLYTVRYVLAVDGEVVPNFTIDIPVEVTSSAPAIINAPPRENTPTFEGPVVLGELIEQPKDLRVGVLIVDEETDWETEFSCRVPWKLEDTQGALLGEMEPNESVLMWYDKGIYHFNRGKGLEKSSYGLRAVPSEKNEICRIDNFDRRVTRDYTHADNTFRNILEYRYNDHKDRAWVINELPIEMYMRGLGETSNISHIEYQKALITAARTYAFYHWSRNSKRVKEHFHITAYADDQVYRGYGQEQRAPKITLATQETHGVIVTYDGEYALTPYFSRSDGRTRAWGEVWNGSVPWLDKSVPTPCDEKNGYPLWGHGVGMSAMEALCMANDGETWDYILKYFYQDIELMKRWDE